MISSTAPRHSHKELNTPPAWIMMIAPTEILFFRWVTLTEQKWVTFRERRRTKERLHPFVEDVNVTMIRE